MNQIILSAPTSDGDDDGILEWGAYWITVELLKQPEDCVDPDDCKPYLYPPSNPARIKFILDLRDENWSVGYAECGQEDITITIGVGNFFIAYREQCNISSSWIKRPLINNEVIELWDLYYVSPNVKRTPQNDNFKVPVYVSNYIPEDESIHGDIIFEGNTFPSGTIWMKDPGKYADALPVQRVEEDPNSKLYTYNNKKFKLCDWEIDEFSTTLYPYTENKYISYMDFVVCSGIFDDLTGNLIGPSSQDYKYIDKEDGKLKYNKRINRNYRETFPLTIVTKFETNALSQNTISFKNPYDLAEQNLPVQYTPKIASGSGYVLEEAFENLNITVNQEPNQKYAFYALPQVVHDGITYNYSFGDFGSGAANAEEVLLTGPATYEAYFKAPSLTTEMNTLYHTGQQKVVSSANVYDQVLFSTYESMGYVWLEKNSNYGEGQWQIINNGKPVSGTLKSKNPTITKAKSGYFPIVLAFKDEDGIKLQIYDVNGSKINETIVYGCSYEDDAELVVASSGQKIIVLFTCYELGEKMTKFAEYYYDGTIAAPTLTRIAFFPYSSNEATHFCMSGSKIEDPSASKIHLVWQESNDDIKYMLYDNSSWQRLATVSSGSGFTENLYPSVIGLNNGYPRVVWKGKRLVDNTGPIDPLKTSVVTGGYEEVLLLRAKSNWNSSLWNETIYSFGSQVEDVDIVSSDDGNYTFGYSTSTASYMIRNSNWTRLNTDNSGQGIVLSQSVTRDKTRLYSVKDMTNYKKINGSATIADILNGGIEIGKTATIEDVAAPTGKEGIISKNEAEFYFKLFDIKADGLSINFIKQEETDPEEPVFNGLKSEAFEKNDNSETKFSIQYGFVDSVDVVTVLQDNKYIKFSASLIDAVTDEVIGTFASTEVDRTNPYSSGVCSYSLDARNIGNRTCYMKISVENNIDGNATVKDIYYDEPGLLKISVKEISYKGELKVTTYDISQNYPNPFNPATVINYQIPEAGNVSLKVYDVLGREVASLVNEHQAEGRYEVKFNASHLSSGVYLYRIEAGKYVSVKKMMLLK